MSARSQRFGTWAGQRSTERLQAKPDPQPTHPETNQRRTGILVMKYNNTSKG